MNSTASTTPVSPAALAGSSLSVNRLAAPLLRQLLDDADALGLRVQRLDSGVTLVDAGIDAPGSSAAGLRIGEICMGGLGRVRLRSGPPPGMHWPAWVEVASAQPVLACLGSQYAGWSLAASKEETGGKKFFALGSGPVRALAGKEALFAELGYRDEAGHAAGEGVLVLEVDRAPPQVVLDKVLRDSGLPAGGLTVILTPTRSLAGTTQVVARVLEVALHKAHELGFALGDIADGQACAPLPAPAADGVEAMGRSNDAILYGGQVQLTVRGTVEAARQLARQLPSVNSRDHGRPFAEVFKAAEYDFYRIDPMLFAPAEVWVSHLDSGATFHAGRCDFELLARHWLQEA
ncbi:MAG TPA: methenyltetrahydromethanopterin cyclohydrolase [Burkholderiaceae bacterium]|jgi:methenyltetrahydromethanopterin cyclohydrolase|nr:methenyltetrahydromethanopterin cyclohydrolase [Burkholderiaceae bacterium]